MAGAKAWVSPVGRLHAVDPESQTVLCGEPLRTLVPFPELAWDAITGIRCRECSRVAPPQNPVPPGPGPYLRRPRPAQL